MEQNAIYTPFASNLDLNAATYQRIPTTAVPNRRAWWFDGGSSTPAFPAIIAVTPTRLPMLLCPSDNAEQVIVPGTADFNCLFAHMEWPAGLYSLVMNDVMPRCVTRDTQMTNYLGAAGRFANSAANINLATSAHADCTGRWLQGYLPLESADQDGRYRRRYIEHDYVR